MLDLLIDVDRGFDWFDGDAAATDQVETITAAIDTCGAVPERTEACLVGAVFGVPLTEAPATSSPRSNSVTSVLADGRGSCAALVAMTLAMTGGDGSPLEAVIFRDHVMLSSRTDPTRFYEALDGGRIVTARELARHKPMPAGEPVRAAGTAFLPYYLDNLAARLANTGDDDGARRLFKQSIELAPDAARFRYNYGTFLLQRAEAAEALDQIQIAIDLGWADSDAYVNRGAAQMQLGQGRRAIKSFRKALSIDPMNRRAKANLRKLEVQLNQPRQ